jgi:hypothetical protein
MTTPRRGLRGYVSPGHDADGWASRLRRSRGAISISTGITGRYRHFPNAEF